MIQDQTGPNQKPSKKSKSKFSNNFGSFPTLGVNIDARLSEVSQCAVVGWSQDPGAADRGDTVTV